MPKYTDSHYKGIFLLLCVQKDIPTERIAKVSSFVSADDEKLQKIGIFY